MRLIDADALEREGWILQRTWQKDKHTMVLETKRPHDFPTVEERKNGKWAKTCQSFVFTEKFRNYTCSECGHDIEKQKYRFCPNCGADMRGDKHE